MYMYMYICICTYIYIYIYTYIGPPGAPEPRRGGRGLALSSSTNEFYRYDYYHLI